MARVWQLLVRADGDTRAAQREIAALQKRTRKLGSGMRSVGQALTMGLTLPLVGLGVLGVRGLMEAERASAQTAAALKSTGNAARTSVAGIETMANGLRRMSGVDDEIIQKGANVLLTFTKISNAGGKAGGNFDKATEAALNMSVALGTDMSSAAMLVGKALNDPIKGITALRRSGVQLTAQQEKQVKAMVAAGDTAGAQRIILGELETQFGGSAKAAGDTFSGQISKAKLSMEEMSESVMAHLMPHLESLAAKLDDLSARFGQMSPKAQKITLVVGLIAAAAGPLLIVVGSLVTAFAAIIPVLTAVSLPVLLVVGAIALLVAAFVLAYTRSETFRAIVHSAFARVRDAIVNIIGEIRATLTVWVEWAKSMWSSYGDEITAVVMFAFNAMRSHIESMLTIIQGIITTAMSLLRGDWKGAWNGIKMIMSGVWDAIKNIVSTAGTAIKNVLIAVWSAIRSQIASSWEGIRDTASRWATSVVTNIENAIGAIKGKIIAIWSAIRDDIPAKIRLWIKGAETAAGEVVGAIEGKLTGLVAKLRTVGQDAGKALAAAIKSAVNAVIDLWNGLSIPGFKVEVAGKSVGVPSVSLPNLPHLAAGGLVSGPTVAMVGEYAGARANPEVVAPLDKLAAMLGNTGGASVTINAPGADAEAVVRKLMFELGGSRLRMGGAV
jgi:phage-related protein